jgi:EmrB/QacA subfamily drug resistance transporter
MAAPLRRRWLTVLAVCLGFFMIMLDTTIVYVATPSIMSGLHSSLDQVLWVFNAYLLTYAVLQITAGRLGDIWGPRNLFLVGLVLFTAASALCGISRDSNELIAARVMQGVGGALLAPQSLTILATTFPPERRGAAIGIWAGVVGLSTVAGPVLGGFVVTYADWRWIFFLNIPVGVVAVAATLAFVPNLKLGARHLMDPVGVVLATSALFLVVFGLIEGQRYDWSSAIWTIIGAGGVVGLAFAVWEVRQPEPLVPLRLFRERNFSLMNWTILAVNFALQGVFIPLAIYTQSVLGMSPLQSGLTVAPMAVTIAVVAPFAGRLADRLGSKYLLAAGLALFAAGSSWVVLIATTTSHQLDFLPAFVVGGLGLGLVAAPMTTLALRRVARADAASASAVINTTRQLGAVLGAAVIGAVLQNRLASDLNSRASAAATLRLPRPLRAEFTTRFGGAVKQGLHVGRGQDGVQVPAGLPPEVAHQLKALVHDVFVNGYVAGMRPTVGVAVAVLGVASASCVLIKGRRTQETLDTTQPVVGWPSPAPSEEGA